MTARAWGDESKMVFEGLINRLVTQYLGTYRAAFYLRLCSKLAWLVRRTCMDFDEREGTVFKEEEKEEDTGKRRSI